MQVSGHFCTLTNPSDGPSARPGPDRSRDDLFAQVRRPGICEPCSRRSPAGSIAARDRSSRCRDRQAVLPPFTGGLHCGAYGRRHRSQPARWCSRRSPAGSIAADVHAHGVLATVACSRRSPAGSIAARRRRLRHRSGAQVLPPFTGGLHCGAMLGRRPARRLPPVLPPFTGGLHCGPCADQRRHRRDDRCSRRSPAGSIAAASDVGDAPAKPSVLPPFTGGLHCGRRRQRRHGPARCRCSRRSPAGSIAALDTAACRRPPERVLPPFTGGLHCGSPRRTERRSGRRSVLPPFTGGLHCGERDPASPGAMAVRCSRRSPAGSIAAAARDITALPARAGAPAVHRRAPLRHVGDGHGSAWHWPVLPPFTGGLHCGARG